MIDPNMTHEQVLARAAELETELEAARAEMKNGPEQMARHDAAEEAMTEFRVYWRQIRESVNGGQHAGVKITNHDGSVNA